MQAFAGPVNETTISWWNEAVVSPGPFGGGEAIQPQALDMTMTVRVKDKTTGTIVSHAVTATELQELAVGIDQQQEWALTDLLITLGYSPNTTDYDCSMVLDTNGLPEDWLHGTAKMSLGADGSVVKVLR